MSNSNAAAPKLLIDYLKLASDHLAAKGVESARLDAELLLADALGLSRVQLYTNHDRPLAAHVGPALLPDVDRRPCLAQPARKVSVAQELLGQLGHPHAIAAACSSTAVARHEPREAAYVVADGAGPCVDDRHGPLHALPDLATDRDQGVVRRRPQDPRAERLVGR